MLRQYEMGDAEEELTKSFQKAPPGGFPWELVHASGLIDKGALGHQRYVPEKGPLHLLVPRWLAHPTTTMDRRQAQHLMPILVKELPEASTMAKGPRAAGAWCLNHEKENPMWVLLMTSHGGALPSPPHIGFSYPMSCPWALKGRLMPS